MTFKVRDLMLNVMPADQIPAGGLQMTECTFATGNPPPKPDAPKPPPCPAASAAPKYDDTEAADVSWEMLAQLRRQLHEALGAGA